MYYQVLRRPSHNQARFMHSLSFVVKNQFPFAEFYNCEVRISQVLLFEEVDRDLPDTNPNPIPNVVGPLVQAQPAGSTNAPPLNTPPAPINSAEDESLEQAIQSLRDATTNNNSSSVQRNPLASIDDRLLRAVLDLAVLVKRNTPSHRAD